MRLAVLGRAVDGAIPAVDGAVVQPQRLELRDAARVQLREGILLDVGAHQRAEAGDVLLVQIDDAPLQPLAAEGDARDRVAQVVAGGADVAGLFEEGDARLGPEAAAEEDRRVDAHRQHRREQELREVVEVGKSFRLRELQMDLEAGVAGFDHHRVVLHHQVVDALDGEVERFAARFVHGAVERHVARVGDHVVEAEVGLQNCRKDPGEHDLVAERLGGLARFDEQGSELRFHVAEAVARVRLGVGVGLDLEEAQLGGEMRIADGFQDLQRAGSGMVGAVDEEHLLLRADARDAALECVLGHHPVERTQVVEHRAHEGAPGRAFQPAAGLLVLVGVVDGHDRDSIDPRTSSSFFEPRS